MSTEEWKDVVGYEGIYQVSNLGYIKRVSGDSRTMPRKILKPCGNGRGYLYVVLYRDHKRRQIAVHRIVALAFLPHKQEETEVNHIDGDKHNNNLENLEWVTPSENAIHAVRILGKLSLPVRVGEKNNNAKLTRESVQQIRQLLATMQYTRREIAKRFDVSTSCIASIARRRTWKHVP